MEPAPSLLDLDLGFLALPRRLCGSPFFKALRPDERWVFVEMLLAARFAGGGEFWFGDRCYALAPGQFIETEQKIADAAGARRKTVRTVRRKARNAGLLSWSKVSAAGRCPSVSTFRDYDRLRFREPPPGPPTGTPDGTVTGTVGGHEKAPSEEGEPREPRDPGNGSPSRSALARTGPRRASRSDADPRHRTWREIAKSSFDELRPGARFDFDGHDRKVLHDFLDRHPDAAGEEWRTVYRRALELGGKYPGTAKVAQALQRWNELNTADARPNGAPVPAMHAVGETGGF